MGYIILFVFLSIIIFVLLCPIKVYLKYDEDFSAVLKYLFVKKNLLEKKEDEEDEKQEKEIEEKPKEEKKEKLEISTIKAGYKALKKGISGLSHRAKKLLKKVKIKNLSVYINISEYEPDRTGEVYGQTTAVVYGIYGLLIENLSVVEKSTVIELNPDFLENQWSYKISAEVSIKPITIIRHGFGISIELLKALSVFNKEMKK